MTENEIQEQDEGLELAFFVGRDDLLERRNFGCSDSDGRSGNRSSRQVHHAAFDLGLGSGVNHGADDQQAGNCDTGHEMTVYHSGLLRGCARTSIPSFGGGLNDRETNYRNIARTTWWATVGFSRRRLIE